MLMTWLGAKAHGIDIERRAVKYAKGLRKGNGWPKYRVGDAQKLPFKKPVFDLVTCMMGTFTGDIQLAAQADLAVRSLYPNKHGEMFLAFAKKPESQ